MRELCEFCGARLDNTRSIYRVGRPRNLQGIRCYGCGRSGHIRRNCPEAKQMSDVTRHNHYERPQAPPAPYKVSTVGEKLFKYIEITLNNVSACALIDTAAAAVTVVSESVYRSSGQAKLLECPLNAKFVEAGGGPLSMIGMTKVNIEIGSIWTYLMVYVCSNLSEKCILGLDFLQKHNCIVDYEKKTLGYAKITAVSGGMEFCSGEIDRVTLSTSTY